MTNNNNRKRPQSLDAVIKYFLNQYEFATKKDVDRVLKKIEELEKMLNGGKSTTSQTRQGRSKTKHKSASDEVLDVISDIGEGANFSEIQAKTQYEDKKLRNIIYRLSKQGKIRRQKRGIYVPV